LSGKTGKRIWGDHWGRVAEGHRKTEAGCVAKKAESLLSKRKGGGEGGGGIILSISKKEGNIRTSNHPRRSPHYNPNTKNYRKVGNNIYHKNKNLLSEKEILI